ncbi:Hsp20/alpha crystallin family protein [Candidatus Dojkabacteria bacterium]|nr:Hsp20/alpha crystallin family protein [Candidatus Dojkabacteria bacterium]
MGNRQIALINPNRLLENNFFDNFFSRGITEYHPNEIEMYEDENHVVVKVKTPGFKVDDLDIDIEDNVLSITGNVTSENSEDDIKRKYYYREIRNESFSRSVSLPTRVKSEQASAEMKNGILEIKMPKAEESKPKKIQIKPVG